MLIQHCKTKTSALKIENKKDDLFQIQRHSEEVGMQGKKQLKWRLLITLDSRRGYYKGMQKL